MAHQSAVIKEAVRNAVRQYDNKGFFPFNKRCGMNLSIEVSPIVDTDMGTIVMYSYDTAIAFVNLANRDENGHAPVELSAYYYNYSTTTSKHLTFFLIALADAGLIGQDVFDRRAKRYKVEARAIEALRANGDNRHDTWFTL